MHFDSSAIGVINSPDKLLFSCKKGTVLFYQVRYLIIDFTNLSKEISGLCQNQIEPTFIQYCKKYAKFQLHICWKITKREWSMYRGHCLIFFLTFWSEYADGSILKKVDSKKSITSTKFWRFGKVKERTISGWNFEYSIPEGENSKLQKFQRNFGEFWCHLHKPRPSKLKDTTFLVGILQMAFRKV